MYYFKNLNGIIEEHPHKHSARVVDGELAPYAGQVLIIGHFPRVRGVDIWKFNTLPASKAFRKLEELNGGEVYYKPIDPQSLEEYIESEGFNLIPSQEIKDTSPKRDIFFPKRQIPVVLKRSLREELKESPAKEDPPVREIKSPPPKEPKQVFDWD